MSLYSDSALVVCIERHRSLAALHEVYSRHGGSAFQLATRLCGHERAEEAVAGAVSELWQRPRRFDPDRSSLRSFLISQTHARAADMARAARRASVAPTLFPDPVRSLDDDPVAPGGPPEELSRDLDEHAGRHLMRLEADEARTLALAYLWGYSCAELAIVLGRSETDVARTLRSALVCLGNRSLSEEGPVNG